MQLTIGFFYHQVHLENTGYLYKQQSTFFYKLIYRHYLDGSQGFRYVYGIYWNKHCSEYLNEHCSYFPHVSN